MLKVVNIVYVFAVIGFGSIAAKLLTALGISWLSVPIALVIMLPVWMATPFVIDQNKRYLLELDRKTRKR